MNKTKPEYVPIHPLLSRFLGLGRRATQKWVDRWLTEAESDPIAFYGTQDWEAYCGSICSDSVRSDLVSLLFEKYAHAKEELAKRQSEARQKRWQEMDDEAKAANRQKRSIPKPRAKPDGSVLEPFFENPVERFYDATHAAAALGISHRMMSEWMAKGPPGRTSWGLGFTVVAIRKRRLIPEMDLFRLDRTLGTLSEFSRKQQLTADDPPAIPRKEGLRPIEQRPVMPARFSWPRNAGSRQIPSREARLP